MLLTFHPADMYLFHIQHSLSDLDSEHMHLLGNQCMTPAPQLVGKFPPNKFVEMKHLQIEQNILTQHSNTHQNLFEKKLNCKFQVNKESALLQQLCLRNILVQHCNNQSAQLVVGKFLERRVPD